MVIGDGERDKGARAPRVACGACSLEAYSIGSIIKDDLDWTEHRFEELYCNITKKNYATQSTDFNLFLSLTTWEVFITCMNEYGMHAVLLFFKQSTTLTFINTHVHSLL
jgi:hypothetical protein